MKPIFKRMSSLAWAFATIGAAQAAAWQQKWARRKVDAVGLGHNLRGRSIQRTISMTTLSPRRSMAENLQAKHSRQANP
jgi:hypothetical protein